MLRVLVAVTGTPNELKMLLDCERNMRSAALVKKRIGVQGAKLVVRLGSMNPGTLGSVLFTLS